MNDSASRKYRRRVQRRLDSESASLRTPSVILVQVPQAEGKPKRKRNRKRVPRIRKSDLEAGLEIFLQGVKVLLQGALVGLGVALKAIGESTRSSGKWLERVNKGRWGPVLIQWLVLFLLGMGAGVLYVWLYVGV